MSAIAYHIGLKLVDERVIAPTSRQRRLVARIVLSLGRGFNLLSFGLADNHLHVVAACSRVAAGQLARRIEISIVKALSLPVGFRPAHFEAIKEGRHLYNAFTYNLRQHERHALDWDPLHESTNLPDLLGMRLIGNYTQINMRQLLPRIHRSELLRFLKVPDLEPVEEPVELVRIAALLAAGLPDFSGRSKETRDAKHAAIQVIGTRMTAKELANRLDVGARTVQRQRSISANQDLVDAIRLQLCLINIRMQNGMKPLDFDEMTREHCFAKEWKRVI